MREFNLIEQNWIPCIDLKGKNIEYGIRDTLLKAHELREVFDDSPLVTVAIHRLLLAILYRAFEGPSDTKQWKELFQTNSFALHSCLHDYLTRWNDRFFLFDEAHPFMQVAKLDLNEYKDNGEIKKDKTDGLMRLATEAPDKCVFRSKLGQCSGAKWAMVTDQTGPPYRSKVGHFLTKG